MVSDRDTQFVGFANLLIKEIDEQVGAVIEWGVEHDIDDEAKIGEELAPRWRAVIARRAYDLVAHTLGIVPHLMVVAHDAEHLSEVMPYVPDLTAWPEEIERTEVDET